MLLRRALPWFASNSSEYDSWEPSSGTIKSDLSHATTIVLLVEERLVE